MKRRRCGLLIAAITPDDSKGEVPLLPRLNRSKPIDSTERVRFKTVKPVQATVANQGAQSLQQRNAFLLGTTSDAKKVFSVWLGKTPVSF